MKLQNKTGICTTIIKCKNQNDNSKSFTHSRNIASLWAATFISTEENYFSTEDNFFGTEIEWYKRLRSNISKPKALDIGTGIGKAMIAMEKANFEVFELSLYTFIKWQLKKQGSSLTA